jgi:hypothetical protein
MIVVGLDKKHDNKEKKLKAKETPTQKEVLPSLENEEKIELQRVVSPPGNPTLIQIRTPDRTFKKEGEYKIILRCKNNDETKDFIKKIEETLTDYKAKKETSLGKEVKLGKYPWREIIKTNTISKPTKVDTGMEMSVNSRVEDGETEGDKESFVDFTFREAGSFVSDGEKNIVEIPVFDSEGNKFTGWISRDEVIRVSADVVPYAHEKAGVGITLRLKAVQIEKTDSEKDKKELQEFGFVEESWDTEGSQEKK